MKVLRTLKEKNSADVKVEIIDINGRKFIRKSPLNINKTEGVLREYNNQKFLYQYSKENDLGFLFYEPILLENSLLLPYLDSVEWMASNENEINYSFDVYKEVFKQFLYACHNITFDILPEEIKEEGLKRDADLLNKFNTDLNYLNKFELKTNEEFENLSKMFIANLNVKAFQHHDLVPWHIARAGKDYYLVDAGWSTWSLWGYDIAYYILHMIAFSSRLDDVKLCYSYVKDLYKEYKNFDNLLDTSFAYIGVRTSARFLREGKKDIASKILDYSLDRSMLL